MGFLEQFATNLANKAAVEASGEVGTVLSRHRWGRLVRSWIAVVLALLLLPLGGFWVVASVAEMLGLIAKTPGNDLWFAFFGVLMIITGLYCVASAVYGFTEGHWSIARRVRWLRWLSSPLIYWWCIGIAGSFIASVVDVAKTSISGAIGMALVGGVIIGLVIRWTITDWRRALRKVYELPEPGGPSKDETLHDEQPTASNDPATQTDEVAAAPESSSGTAARPRSTPAA